MPTRNLLFLLFGLLVAVPVGAAAWLGLSGLERERDSLVAREREAMERRADELRDALVRELQKLHRAAAKNEPTAPGVISDRFTIPAPGRVEWRGKGRPPADIEALARSALVRVLLERGALAGAGRDYLWQGELAYRLVEQGNRRRVEGFRVDPERLARRFLDPFSQDSVVPRFDERLEEVRLVRDDPRELIPSPGPFGLPRTFFRYVVPARRNAPPVLFPPGHLLAIAMHPAPSLERDLEQAGRGLALALGVVGAVVLFGMLFLWRALRAEARLAQRKAEFVNTVSHELRTPLTSIRMYADLLKEGWVKDPETAREYVGLVSAESERLARLVNNVLDFARIEKGRKSFRFEEGDPAPVIRETAEVLRPYLRERGFALGIDVPERLAPCRFDKDALTQILVNLIDNAVKYGREEVRVEARLVGPAVELRVLDRGRGVDEADRERIFEPFTRGRDAPGGGSGLGLALVRHYAEAHGGSAGVSARDGGGACFRVRLPRRGSGDPFPG